MKNKISLSAMMLGLVLLSGNVRAEDDDGLRRLITAKTPEQLSHRVAEKHRLEHDHLVCESELRGHQIPVACFRYLSQSDTENSQEFAWLQPLCRDRVRASKDRKDLERAENESRLPASCRDLARERAADLRYADEAEHPSELFERLVKGKARP